MSRYESDKGELESTIAALKIKHYCLRVKDQIINEYYKPGSCGNNAFKAPKNLDKALAFYDSL